MINRETEEKEKQKAFLFSLFSLSLCLASSSVCVCLVVLGQPRELNTGATVETEKEIHDSIQFNSKTTLKCLKLTLSPSIFLSLETLTQEIETEKGRTIERKAPPFYLFFYKSPTPLSLSSLSLYSLSRSCIIITLCETEE